MMSSFELIRDQLFLGGRRLVLSRLTMMFGLLFVVALLGFIPLIIREDMKILAIIVAVAAGLAGSIILYRQGRFENAILALIPLATLTNFFTLPTGSASRLVLSLAFALVLIAIWLFQTLVLRKKYALRSSPANASILWFVGISIFAYFWSNLLVDPTLLEWSHYITVRLGALAVNIGLPLLTLLVFNKLKEEKWLKWITWVTVGIGGFVILAVLLHLRLDALFQNGYRGLFATWVVSLAYAMALFNEHLPKWLRGLLLLVVAGWVIQDFLLHTSWLSGWVPFAVSLAIITIIRSRKLFFTLAVTVLVLAALNLPWLVQRIYQDKVAQGDTNRPLLWAMNLDLVSKHPLFGVGPAGYAPYYMTYHPEFALSTHNNYFDVLAQTGVVGSLVFIWMFATLLWIGGATRRAVSGRRNFQEGYANAVFAGLVGALVSMMLGDWLLPFAYNQTISGFDNALFTWIFLGGMLSLYAIVKNRGETPPEGEAAK